MSKGDKIKKFDSIPLPVIIQEALLSVPEDYSYVSHKTHQFDPQSGNRISNPPPVETADCGLLSTTSHGFYIGKLFPVTPAEKVFRLLGWKSRAEEKSNKSRDSAQSATSAEGEREPQKKPQERLYSEELIEASLAYLFAKLKPGQKVYYVIGPYLSELINGRADVANAFSADHEQKLVMQIARRRFGGKADSLEIVKVEDMPEHQEIFSALKDTYDAKLGRADADKVLAGENEPLGERPSSLQIARYLYSAAQKNRMLSLRFISTVPEMLKKDVPEDEVNRAKNYGIIEVATRLYDLLNGRNIQGGAERQGVYDDIIIHILQGPNGKFRSVRELQELLELCAGRKFETIHVNSKENPPLLRGIRNRARARLAMLGLVLGGSLSAVYGLGESKGRQHQQDLQARIDGTIEEKIKDKTFYFDYKWPLDKDKNVMAFHHVSEGVLVQIRDRYNLPAELVDDLRPQVESFLLEPEQPVSAMNEEVPLRIVAADEFVARNRVFFMSKGYKLDRPYAHLSEYLPYFDRCLAENFTAPEEEHRGAGPTSRMQKNERLEMIGRVRSGGGYSSVDSYKLALYTDDSGNKHLVAANDAIQGERVKDDAALLHPEIRAYIENPLIYSSKTARQMVCHYVREMKRYEAYKFEKYNSLFNDLLFSSNFNDKESWSNLDENFVVTEKQEWRLKKLGNYRDFAGAFDFELAVYKEYVTTKDGEKIMKEQLVARQYDEKRFSTATAILAAKHYKEADDERYSGWKDCRDW